jgi:hypothetical protein
MSPQRWNSATVDELVAVYAEAAMAHARASGEGDHRRTNKQHDIVADAYRELRRRGSDAQNALLAMREHPDPGLRSWIGAHALEFAPVEGEHILSELARAGGLQGFNAEMTLTSWRQGDLEFP